MHITIASHNTMHGVYLKALLGYYRRLAAEHRLDVLCLQENVPLASCAEPAEARTQAHLVGQTLESFQCLCQPDHPGLATLVSPAWQVEESFLVPLPRLERLSWVERMYIAGGVVKQKYALVSVLRKGPHALTVVNFHLDTAGDNAHRRRQVAAIAGALSTRGIARHVVACGDTNAFTWSRTKNGSVLVELMEPLCSAAGAKLCTELSATHFFARQREPLLTHRLLTWIGKLGIDHPLAYDVICSDLELVRSGQVVTTESDHDLVYAKLSWPSASAIRHSSG